MKTRRSPGGAWKHRDARLFRAVLSLLAALALPSARRRHEQAVSAGVDDLPPAPVEV